MGEAVLQFSLGTAGFLISGFFGGVLIAGLDVMGAYDTRPTTKVVHFAIYIIWVISVATLFFVRAPHMYPNF